MSGIRYAFALTAPLLCCAPVLAQGKPAISEVVDVSGRVGETEAGRPLQLKGRNLHTCSDEKCRHDELKVRIGSKNAMVTIATAEMVQVTVPVDLKEGNHRVVFEARGRGTANTRVRVLKQGSIKDTEGNIDPADAARRGFAVSGFAYERSSRGARFKVSGRAKVPDGFVLRLRLNFANQTKHVAERMVTVKKEAFETTFGPFRKQVNLGNWRVELFFSLSLQSRPKLRRWMRPRKGPRPTKAQINAMKRIVRQSHTSVGAGPDGKIPQASLLAAREEVKSHVKPLLGELKKLLDEGKEAYGLAARCYFRKKGQSSYDSDGYEKWLVDKGYAADADAAKKIARDTRYGTRRGHFDAKAYETFGQGWIKKLGDLHKQQEKFDGRTLVPVDERVSKGVKTSLGLALRLQQKWTQQLHQRAGISIPVALKNEPFLPQVTLQPSWKTVQAEIKKTEGMLP